MPNATKEEWEAANEEMRIAASPETAARYYHAFGDVDVTALLREVQARTLVMHVRGDLRVPFQSGRQLAAAIPNARFVALPGNSHAFSLGSPAADRFLEENSAVPWGLTKHTLPSQLPISWATRRRPFIVCQKQ